MHVFIVGASFALVELKIPFGDRPQCEQIDQMREEGSKELVELMKKCWDDRPSERPTFKGKCSSLSQFKKMFKSEQYA